MLHQHGHIDKVGRRMRWPQCEYVFCIQEQSDCDRHLGAVAFLLHICNAISALSRLFRITY